MILTGNKEYKNTVNVTDLVIALIDGAMPFSGNWRECKDIAAEYSIRLDYAATHAVKKWWVSFDSDNTIIAGECAALLMQHIYNLFKETGTVDYEVDGDTYTDSPFDMEWIELWDYLYDRNINHEDYDEPASSGIWDMTAYRDSEGNRQLEIYLGE